MQYAAYRGRVFVQLEKSEYAELRKIAERECRTMGEQARYFIIRGLAADIAASMPPPEKSSDPRLNEEGYDDNKLPLL